MLISEIKNEYTDRILLMCDKWSVEIDNLSTKINQAGAQKRAEYHLQIEALYRKKDKAHKRLMDLEKADEDTWETIKSGTEIAWNNMTDALSSAKLMLKKEC